MGFHVWERQQLEKMTNGAIKATKAQIKQFEAANKTDQLRSAKGRLKGSGARNRRNKKSQFLPIRKEN